MTTTQDARRDDSGGIITITFTRDKKLNAVTLPMLEMLEEAGHDLASDDRQRVLLITAEGRYFTPGGDISRLTRIVGAPWAKWIAMAGQTVDAQQAREIGLVQAVYPQAEFAARARAFAEPLASFPREAVGLAKLAIDAAEHGDRRTARDVDRIAQTLLLTGPEYRQKIDVFLSRSPLPERSPLSERSPSPGSDAKKA